MNPKLYKISRLLSEYSLGHLNKRLPLAKQNDDLDEIILGLNMLGEELEQSTIGRNYFNDIFNSVTEMILVIDTKGTIINVNQATCKTLVYDNNELENASIDKLKPSGCDSMVKLIKGKLSNAANGF